MHALTFSISQQHMPSSSNSDGEAVSYNAPEMNKQAMAAATRAVPFLGGILALAADVVATIEVCI